jgi:hypothetical protein
MLNIDLETFYKRIKKSIEVVVAFSGNQQYRAIIRACRLKPLEVFRGNIKYTPQLYKIWADEYGNTLNVESGNITLNDPVTPPKSKQTTDLFFGIPFNQHIEKAMRGIFFGNDFPEMIAFYGYDEYIRCVNVSGFGMVRISPLEFGLEPLSKLISGSMGKIVPDRYKNGVVVRVNNNLRIEDLFDGR